MLLGVGMFAGIQYISSDKVSEDQMIAFGSNEIEILVKRHPNSSSDMLSSAIRKELDEEILFQESIKQDLHQYDAVVIDRIERNLEFLTSSKNEGESSSEKPTPQNGPSELVIEDMVQSDPVIRRRMIAVMRQQIRHQGEDTNITREDLDLYIRDHAEEYVLPEKYSFSQVFIDPRRHSDNLESILSTTLTELKNDAFSETLGDASILPIKSTLLTRKQIEGQFGNHFASRFVGQSVEEDLNQWLGPVQSAFGIHFVRIESYTPPKLPQFSRIYNRVYIKLKADHKAHTLANSLAQLREQYFIEFEGQTINVQQFPDYWRNRENQRG